MTLMKRVRQLLERWWHWLDAECFPMVAMSCDHCGIVAQIPVRKVTVRMTGYAAESFATTRCEECHSIVARKVSFPVAENLIAGGARFRLFRDSPPITEADVEAFASALDDADVVQLAKGEPQ